MADFLGKHPRDPRYSREEDDNKRVKRSTVSLPEGLRTDSKLTGSRSVPEGFKYNFDPELVFTTDGKESVDPNSNKIISVFNIDSQDSGMSGMSGVTNPDNDTSVIPFTGDETLNIDYFLTFVDQIQTYVKNLGQPRTYNRNQPRNFPKKQVQKQGIMKKYNIMYENMRQYFVHVIDKIIGNNERNEETIAKLMDNAMIKLQDAVRSYVKKDALLKNIDTISILNIGSQNDEFDPTDSESLTLHVLFERDIQHISILTLRAMMQGLYDLYNEQKGQNTYHRTHNMDDASLHSGMITEPGDEQITPDASAKIFLKIMMPKIELNEDVMNQEYMTYGEYFEEIMKNKPNPQRSEQMINYPNFVKFTATNKENFVNNTNNFDGYQLGLEILLNFYNTRVGMMNNENETYPTLGGKKRKTKRRMKKKSEKSRVKKHTKSKRKSTRRKAKK